MALSVLDSSGSLLCFKISGELRKSEFDQMQAVAARAIQRWGRIRALGILEDFRGWERGPDWSDVSFVVEHDKEIEKIAIVGDESWKDLVYAFSGRSLRSTAIEYFGPSDLERARGWLREGEAG